MKTKQISLKHFIREHGIDMISKTVEKNPHMNDMPRNFKCTLRRGEPGVNYQTMSTFFSQGSAHTEHPTIEDVLDCLASDCSSYENAKDFEDWAGEYGFDTDSRKVEKIFKIVAKQRDELKTFLGDAYEQLLYNTERM